MPEPAQTADTTNTTTAFGWCAWHQNYARGVRLIHVDQQGSSSGANRFACRTCREVYDLVPPADQP
ncbi:hypothetical protein AB0I77_26590 [Streptomyces sp. NPDC050619]|uniref:hypothetical protein n=1 Tax=Streptomyces sp. NPDC050619 TaxID=3157214 RepID=UPI003419D4D9